MTLPYSFLRLILFFVLFPVIAYLLLRFFGRLTGISMFAAMAWGFKVKLAKPIILFPILSIILYFVMYSMAFIFFQIPVQIYEMHKNHAGGLLGYQDSGMQAGLYDPSEKSYVSYPLSIPPLPAGKFTDTFAVTLLYKSSTSKYYNNTEILSLPAIILELIVSSLMLVFLYPILFTLASEYIKENNLPNELSHPAMAAQFQKVSPHDTVSGVIIRRFQSYERESHLEGFSDDKRKREKNTYYSVFHYTVEFRNLIRIPVYLDLALRGGREDIKELDALFLDRRALVPDKIKELAFTVNPDYSISLKK